MTGVINPAEETMFELGIDSGISFYLLRHFGNLFGNVSLWHLTRRSFDDSEGENSCNRKLSLGSCGRRSRVDVWAVRRLGSSPSLDPFLFTTWTVIRLAYRGGDY